MNDLECLLQIAPILERLLQTHDATIAIANDSEIVYYKDGNTIHAGHVGYQIQPGDGLYEAVHEQKEFVDTVPAEVLGVPFRSTAIPIIDENGASLGVIGMAASLSKQNRVAAIAQNIVHSLHEISSSVESMAQETQKISESHETILELAKQSAEQSSGASGITDFIQRVSEQTKILGLNASIEAARSGEYGRSFSVIAQEIRKLAETTKSAVKRIEQGLDAVSQSTREVDAHVTENAKSIEMQAGASQQVMASVQELLAICEQLSAVANEF